MPRYVESQDRQQVTLLPECLDDFIGEDNPVRVVDAFVDELDLAGIGFEGMMPASTGRPSWLLEFRFHEAAVRDLTYPANFQSFKPLKDWKAIFGPAP